MAALRRIRLTSFRNFDKAEFEISENTNVIFGPNGVGKTNLLESVYATIYKGRSFYQYSQPLIKNGAGSSQTMLEFTNPEGFSEEIGMHLKKGEKNFFRNGKRVIKSDFQRKYPLLTILPEDKAVFRNEPKLRRFFFDRSLKEVDSEYEKMLIDYDKVCRTRRFLMYQQKDDGIYLAEWMRLGSSIVRKRISYLNELNRILRKRGYPLLLGYATTAGQPQSVDQKQIADGFENCWRQKEREEREKKKILIGPQLDDFRLIYEGRDTRFFASSGETKLAVFWLKLAQAEYIKKELGTNPILLIDEFLESLDEEKAGILKAQFSGSQLFITSCHEVIFRFFGDSRRIEIGI
ncbi:MAG: DNA replication and repair protein RecF [Candidatus Wallbacteria bacterium]|nr:DNA replication and repair protein RecF [Candidatus Wallbacteria bacterium]